MGMTHSQYLRIARIVAETSKCKRKKVGAVIVKGGKVLSTGYNGTPSGADNTCECEGQTLPQVIHAELNAILNATTHDLSGAIMYVTLAPCMSCAGLILQKKISCVIYLEDYHSDGVTYLSENNVPVIKFEDILITN